MPCQRRKALLAYLLVLLYHKHFLFAIIDSNLLAKHCNFLKQLMECLKKAKDAVWFLTPHPCYRNQLWSVRHSNINFAPSLKAYSKMAASARLMYSLQQSWNYTMFSLFSLLSSQGKSRGLCLRQRYLSLRLASELADLRGKYPYSLPLCGTSSSQSVKTEKEQGNRKGYPVLFLVEVAGLELAASSSRTNTPSFFDYFCWLFGTERLVFKSAMIVRQL